MLANNTSIIGNLGKDAVVRMNEKTGKEFVTFPVAVTESCKNAEGEKTEQTTWFDCVTSKTAVSDYLVKGKQVALAGQVSSRAYLKEDGTAGSSLQLRVSPNSIKLLGAKAGEQTGGGTDPVAAQEPGQGVQGEPTAKKPAVTKQTPVPVEQTPANGLAPFTGPRAEEVDDLPF